MAAFAFFPTWLVEQPNPDWRMVSWALGFEIVAMSLCAVYWLGGKPWLKHFAFPVCFILAAIPWPTDVELIVIQNLMRTVAAITVALLNCFVTFAEQEGAVIKISAGQLGIDAASRNALCNRLSWPRFFSGAVPVQVSRRFLLISAGALIAFLCNVGRAFFLACVAAREGIAAISKYHDPAGYLILTICFLIVWSIALLLPAPKPEPFVSREKNRPFLLPKPLLIGLGAWLALALAATEAGIASTNRAKKSIGVSRGRSKTHNFKTCQSLNRLLNFCNTMMDAPPPGKMTTAAPGWPSFSNGMPARRAPEFSRSEHRPDICLPAGGYKLQNDGTVPVKVSGIEIPFHAYAFARGPTEISFTFFSACGKTARKTKRVKKIRRNGIASRICNLCCAVNATSASKCWKLF